jgi:hypothetical protein
VLLYRGIELSKLSRQIVGIAATSICRVRRISERE